MSDLNKAIAEVKRMRLPRKPFNATSLANSKHPSDLSHIATILNAVVSDALTPAPQIPEDVEKLPDQCEPTGDWRKVIAGLNASDPQDMLVIKPLIEAQAAENADLRAANERLASLCRTHETESEANAERTLEAQAEVVELLSKLAEAGTTIKGLRAQTTRLMADYGAGTFAQGIEAAAQTLEERGSDGWAEYAMSEYASVCCEAIRALTPPVAARETPIRCHQAGLTTAGEQQAPQADPVREAADNMMPGAIEALAAYQQADMDGIMVLVSRQAIEECLPVLRAVARMETTHD